MCLSLIHIFIVVAIGLRQIDSSGLLFIGARLEGLSVFLINHEASGFIGNYRTLKLEAEGSLEGIG